MDVDLRVEVVSRNIDSLKTPHSFAVDLCVEVESRNAYITFRKDQSVSRPLCGDRASK